MYALHLLWCVLQQQEGVEKYSVITGRFLMSQTVAVNCYAPCHNHFTNMFPRELKAGSVQLFWAQILVLFVSVMSLISVHANLILIENTLLFQIHFWYRIL